MRRQLAPQLLPHRGLRLEQPLGPRAHRFELLLGVVAVGGDVFDTFLQLLQRGCHANHEELVEVAPGDAEELHALEQRMGRVAGLFEHTLVEREPAQLAIDVERGFFRSADRPHASEQHEEVAAFAGCRRGEDCRGL